MSGQINLFNPIFLAQKKHFSAATMAQAMGLVVLGSILMTMYMTRQLSVLGTQAASTSVALTGRQAQLAKVNADYVIKPKSTALEAELAKVEGELKSLQSVSGILQKGEFGNTQGYAEYMRAFARQAQNGMWLTGFSITGAGTDIGLKGRALQPELVPAYIGRLSKEAVMRGKSFAALDMQMTKKTETTPRIDARTGKTLPPMQVPAYIEFSLQSSEVKRDDATVAVTK